MPRTSRGTGGSRNNAGFTLMEMVVVIIILGVLMAVVFPSLDGVTPKYRLRAGARELGSKINHIRSLAGSTGKSFGLHYDIDNGRYWTILPPGDEEDPDLPLDERERGVTSQLPDFVVIQEVTLLDGTSVANGEVDVVIDPVGNEGSHIIFLRNEDDALIALKFNAMLGFVDFFEDEVKFERYQ